MVLVLGFGSGSPCGSGTRCCGGVGVGVVGNGEFKQVARVAVVIVVVVVVAVVAALVVSLIVVLR